MCGRYVLEVGLGIIEQMPPPFVVSGTDPAGTDV